MVEIKELYFRYKKKENLFGGLSADLGPGRIYGLLGKNGAGKTTLLKIICGLLFPGAGTCRVNGLESRQRDVRMLSEICFIPEEFYVPPVTGKRYVKLYSPFYPKFSMRDFRKFVTEFELDADEVLSSMSYGQKKKFLIAFGLASNSNLFILDEPTNGLDIPSKSQFRKLLASSLTEDRTFLISTHQVRDMTNLIDTVIILESGEIIFNETTYDVSKQLTIYTRDTEPAAGEVLYCEKILGGYAVIDENRDHEEAHLDLELLFNAIINRKDRIEKIFNREAVR